jgi:hypothetical protein
MFGRIRRVNGPVGPSSEPSGDDVVVEPVVEDLQLRRSCREFLEAVRACAAFDLDAPFAEGGPQAPIYCESLEIAREKRERALEELKRLPASCSAGFRAKCEALFALKELLGKEDFRVVDLALELAGDVSVFFAAGQAGGSEPVSKIDGGSSGARPQSRLSLPRFLWFYGQPRSSPPRSARRSQTRRPL